MARESVSGRILVIDDEPGVRESLGKILEYEGYEVFLAENGAAGIDRFRRESPDLVLLDIKMPGMDGMEVLRELLRVDPHACIIMISGHGTIQTAYDAGRAGAHDFLEKPLDQDQTLFRVQKALEGRALRIENARFRAGEEARYQILGESRALRDVLAMAKKVGPTNARVLIRGENGTGKELLARYVHRRSGRSGAAFVEVNCAAIPRELVESELFGHEKGSFTGAYAKKIGKFQQAHGGTLFLDEIGDMSFDTQAKVLRALQDGVIQRVGGREDIQVDVRVISATNKNLEEEIEARRFREDLYYRLNVVTLRLPPLRDRREDVPLLAEAFLGRFVAENGMRPIRFAPDAIDALRSLPWPGNVRELKNTVERLAILVGGEEIGRRDVQAFTAEARRAGTVSRAGGAETFVDFKELSESAFLRGKLEENAWNVSETARRLGMQRSNLYKKIEKFGLRRDGD